MTRLRSFLRRHLPVLLAIAIAAGMAATGFTLYLTFQQRTTVVRERHDEFCQLVAAARDIVALARLSGGEAFFREATARINQIDCPQQLPVEGR